MKKLRLKKWVKVVMVVSAFTFLIVLYNNQYKNAVRQCVNAGNSQNYCESGLR